MSWLAFLRFELAVRELEPRKGVRRPNNYQQPINNIWHRKTRVERNSLGEQCVQAWNAEAEWERKSRSWKRHSKKFLAIAESENIASLLHDTRVEDYERAFLTAEKAQQSRQNANTNIAEQWTGLRRILVEQSHNDAAVAYADRKIRERSAENSSINALLIRISNARHPRIPSDRNGIRKMRKQWYRDIWMRRQAGSLDKQNRASQNAQPNNDNIKWHAQVAARSGSQASAWLWLGSSSDDVVQDRLCRKDCDFNDQWFDFRYWHSDPATGVLVPLELQTHTRMNGTQSDTVVRMRRPTRVQGANVNDLRARLNSTDRSYSCYLAWCPFGDLADVIAHYDRPETPVEFIPEAFIWSVAEGLARAGLAMFNGTTSRTASAVNAWNEIVHRDIKPNNIFLTNPQTGSNATYRMYPTIQLADFGFAIETHDNDRNNPHWYREDATNGFYAPELEEWVDYRTNAAINDDWRVDQKTNVFQVGVVLYCLVILDFAPSQADWLGDGIEDATYKLVDSGKKNVERYSADLLELIDWCTSYLPESLDENKQRPSFDEILEYIEARVQTTGGLPPTGGDASGGLRTTTDQRTVDANRLNHPLVDTYRLGLSRNDFL